MELDEKRMQQIVERVMSRLGVQGAMPDALVKSSSRSSTTSMTSSGLSDPIRGFPRGSLGVFSTVDDAVSAARHAFEQLSQQPLSLRYKLVAAMRAVTLRHVQALSEYAHTETGLGRVSDKIRKNTLATEKTPGPEILVPEAFTGDRGLTLIEQAPFGVIGSITPCTNPTETIICNAISFIASGNTAVFNAHPTARSVSAYHIHLLNEAMISVGGPPNLLTTLAEPSIASAEALMTHAGIRLLVVTGGPAVVKAAMNSGKKVVAAGPGNPPVVVDDTADIVRAAKGIINGASFDNNVICCDEKEVFAVASIFDSLRHELKQHGAYELSETQMSRLTKQIFPDGEHINKDFVGKNVSVILDSIGLKVGDEVRLAFSVVDEMHPLVSHEQLMPILPLVRAQDVWQAIEMAKRAEGGRGHTASVYSRNIEVMHHMARTMDTCIFVKNGPHYVGLGGEGEGYTSWTIAHPTGEGLTCAKHFTRTRRCALQDYFRIV